MSKKRKKNKKFIPLPPRFLELFDDSCALMNRQIKPAVLNEKQKDTMFWNCVRVFIGLDPIPGMIEQIRTTNTRRNNERLEKGN